MKLHHGFAFAALLVLLAGCGTAPDKPVAKNPDTPAQAKPADPAPAPDREAKIAATLKKLSDDDRELAESQRFCAVQNKTRLGSMGLPPKIKIKNKEGEEVEVFLCCAGCEAEARKDEARTAARVAEMKIDNALAKLSPEDRKAAEAQKYCVTAKTSRLGSMGAPTKVMVKDKDGQEHPVFFCCGGCERIIKKEGEEKVLAIVDDLVKKNAAPAPK